MAVRAKYCFETLYPYASALSSAEQQIVCSAQSYRKENTGHYKEY